MESKTKARYEEKARIIKALAHPSRLMVVEELLNGKRCVAELTRLVGSDTSTVSKHLNVLKNSGLVFVEKKGTTVFYHLKMPCLTDFLRCVDSVMATNAAGFMEIIN